MLKVEQQAVPYVITFEIDSNQLNNLFDLYWDRIKDEIELDGFRKGSVSKEVAEQKIGFDKLYSNLLPDVYLDELNKSDIDIIYSSEPKIYGRFNRDGCITLKTDCYFSPKVELCDLKDIVIEDNVVFVTDEEIEKEISKKRQVETQESTDNAIEYGNMIILDFVGYVDGSEVAGSRANRYKMIVGNTNMITGFEDQLIGMKKGDEKQICVQFPDQYHRENLAGKPAVFDIKIHDVFIQIKLSDDELIEKEQCLTIDNLRNQIKIELLNEKESMNLKFLTTSIIKQLVEKSKIEPIPTPCINQELDRKLQQFVEDSGKTLDEMRKMPNFDVMFESNNKPLIIEGIKSTLVLQALQKHFQVTISEDEIQSGCVARYRDKQEVNSPKYLMVESQLKVKKAIDNLVKALADD